MAAVIAPLEMGQGNCAAPQAALRCKLRGRATHWCLAASHALTQPATH